jgi:hypothetical protein
MLITLVPVRLDFLHPYSFIKKFFLGGLFLAVL